MASLEFEVPPDDAGQAPGLLAALLGAIPAALFLLDGEGRVLAASHRATALVGRDLRAGTPIGDVLTWLSPDPEPDGTPRPGTLRAVDGAHGVVVQRGAIAEGPARRIVLLVTPLADLNPPDTIRVRREPVAVAVQRVRERIQEQAADLHRLARTDALTGLWNRREFMDRLAIEAQRATRSGVPLSLLLLDVDHFKQFNDRNGHPAGDAVLRHVASVIRGRLRGTDLPVRLGGEEFGALLPDTRVDGARLLAEEIRRQLETGPLPASAGVPADARVTASIGLVECRRGESPDALVARVDQALYAAKRAGRNCVVIEDSSA